MDTKVYWRYLLKIKTKGGAFSKNGKTIKKFRTNFTYFVEKRKNFSHIKQSMTKIKLTIAKFFHISANKSIPIKEHK